MPDANILVVDDEDSIRHFVSRSLKDDGYHVRSAGTAGDARAAFSDETPDLVILDMKLGQDNGLDLLSEFKRTAWRNMTQSIQPGRRRRPVTVPNSRPISTNRSPPLGSSPVVSVSKIISRITELISACYGSVTRGLSALFVVH